MPSSLTVTRNAARGFRRRAVQMERTLPTLMRRAGRLCAVSLATQTQPFGVGANAQQLGQVAVIRDIRKVYALPSDAFPLFGSKFEAAGFWKLIQAKDWAGATAILHRDCRQFSGLEIRPFDGGQAHRANRVHGRVKANQTPVYVVQDPAELKDYINREIAQVGFAKAGWAICALALGGTSGLPDWITKHKAPGRAEQRNSPGLSEVVLVNQVTYASEVLSESQKRVAVEIAMDRLFKALVIEERKIAQAAGF